MPQVPKVSVENNFTGGLKTEFTGLNFPANACTDTANCIFDITGNVTRRPGFTKEPNGALQTITRPNAAFSMYKWNNAGGDGSTQIIVEQVGAVLNFYLSSSVVDPAVPLSQTFISSVLLNSFLPVGSSNDVTNMECQFSDGNGFLFVYHPYTEPFYCAYNSSGNSIACTAIMLLARDFQGIPEIGVPDTFRPNSLSNEHTYNLYNQGWAAPQSWLANSTTQLATSFYSLFSINNWINCTQAAGTQTYTVQTGISGISGGQAVNISTNVNVQYTILGGATTTTVFSMNATGTVGSYNSGTGALVLLSVTAMSSAFIANTANSTIAPTILSQVTSINAASSTNKVTTWFSDIGNYPSNADIWYVYKDSTDVFDPTTTFANVQQPQFRAPQGHFILNVFNQNRNASIYTTTALTNIITYVRPRTGCWFQGRVWYAGVDARSLATGDAPLTSWTENIYFSRIVTDTSSFGLCYQDNDPTDENLNQELATDGGVINIQGMGACYKLFPIQNGLLVFAANGIWFITGSRGIGFSATDYTITKISGVRCISGSSFVNVNGLPLFWNEEGIYQVTPTQQGLGLTVDPITVGTILSYFNNIPIASRKYVRGDYNPITYIIQWLFKSTPEASATDRYDFDTILNYNIYTKAFYPYTFDYSISTTPRLHGIIYFSSPNGVSVPEPRFKYSASTLSSSTNSHIFAEESEVTIWKDWPDFGPIDFTSYFVTGYKLEGQAVRQWQPQYIYMYSDNSEPTAYKIQGIWNYASSGNSGNYSSVQTVNNSKVNFGKLVRRHRIRGRGLVLQLKVTSVSGSPFNIEGWGIWENINAGV